MFGDPQTAFGITLLELLCVAVVVSDVHGLLGRLRYPSSK